MAREETRPAYWKADGAPTSDNGDFDHIEFAPTVPLLRTAPEIIALPDPDETDLLLGPYVVKGQRTIVVGDTGHGKTTFVMQLVNAVLSGKEMLHHVGAANGPALVIDLEQGLRSIKRTIREAGAAERDDLLYLSCPDGMALDSNPADLALVETIVSQHSPSIVVLDPFYKAHRGDANDERGITQLMRSLDWLRAAHGFALIMPAHPRKDVPQNKGARQLTLHDVAGSGAVVRGAEIVIALERLSHGYARLRYLKDRDGDLPVGDIVPLIYSRADGFRPDPKEEQSDELIEQRILAMDDSYRTVGEWAAELKIRRTRAQTVLDRMVATGAGVHFVIGPPGRSPKSHCYGNGERLFGEELVTPNSDLSGARDKSGQVTLALEDTSTCPTRPPYRGDGVGGQVPSSPKLPGQVDSPDVPF